MKTWLRPRVSSSHWILDDDKEGGADVDDWVDMADVKLVCFAKVLRNCLLLYNIWYENW